MNTEVPPGWEEKTLGSCALYINGYAFKPEDWHEFGTPIIRIKQLHDANAHYDSCPRDLPEKFVINNGDLIFSWSATLSLKIWDRGKAFLNQHLYKVIARSGVDKIFLKYLIEFNLDSLAGETHGSTMKHITRPHLLEYCVALPKSISEQKKIASILQSVDNAIYMTMELIEKYEKMKQRLIQDLFTRGIDENYKPHTELKDSALGEIPRNWKVYELGSMGSFKNGINKDKDAFGHGVKFVNIIDAYADELDLASLGRLDANHNEVREYKLEEGDIIFVRSSVKPEGVGYNTLFSGYKEEVLFCGFMIRFRLFNKHDNTPLFFNYYFRSEEFRRRLLSRSSVSANTNINQVSLRKLLCVVPLPDEQKRMCGRLISIDNSIHSQEALVNKLTKIKNGLMQDLLTGKVRVAAYYECRI